MKYKVRRPSIVQKQIENYKKKHHKLHQKYLTIIDDLKSDPYKKCSGFEALKDNLSGYYSRRLSNEHRMVYSIHDECSLVVLYSVHGHYDNLKKKDLERVKQSLLIHKTSTSNTDVNTGTSDNNNNNTNAN